MKKVSLMLALTVAGSMASANLWDKSKESSQKMYNSSTMVVGNVSDFMGNTSQATGEAAGNAYKGAREMTMKAFAWSKNTAVAVWETSTYASENPSEASTKAANWVVTKTGEVFKASVNSTKTAVRVTVDAAGNVFTDMSQASVGSAKTVKESAVSAGVYMMDASGRLWNAAGEMVGTVWTASKNGAKATVGFMTDSSGKIYAASKKGAMLVVKGGKAAMEAMSNAFAASSEWTNKWVLTPVSEGFAVLTNGSSKYLVMSYEAAAKFLKSGEATDLSQYGN